LQICCFDLKVIGKLDRAIEPHQNLQLSASNVFTVSYLLARLLSGKLKLLKSKKAINFTKNYTVTNQNAAMSLSVWSTKQPTHSAYL